MTTRPIRRKPTVIEAPGHGLLSANYFEETVTPRMEGQKPSREGHETPCRPAPYSRTAYQAQFFSPEPEIVRGRFCILNLWISTAY